MAYKPVQRRIESQLGGQCCLRQAEAKMVSHFGRFPTSLSRGERRLTREQSVWIAVLKQPVSIGRHCFAAFTFVRQ